MQITNGQSYFLYRRIEHLFPSEMKNFDDNKLSNAIDNLSLEDYKYLLAMSYNKQDDIIIKYLTEKQKVER